MNVHLKSAEAFAESAVIERGFLPVSVASVPLGVSRQRVYQLIERGKLDVWLFLGGRYVSLRQIFERLRCVTRERERSKTA